MEEIHKLAININYNCYVTNEISKGYNLPGPLAVVLLLGIAPVGFIVEPETVKNDTLYQ